MLRPMLEQAADPLHSMRTGQGPSVARQFRKAAGAATTPMSSSSVPAQSEDDLKEMPSTVTLFKPDVSDYFINLFQNCIFYVLFLFLD